MNNPIYQPPFIGSVPFHAACYKMDDGFGSHWHGELEIIYLKPQSGCITVIIDGNEYLLSPRDAVFVSATQTHSIHVDESTADVLVIEFGFSLLGNDFSVFAEHQFKNPVVRFSQLQSNDVMLQTEKTLNDIIEICSSSKKDLSEWKPAEKMKISSMLFSLSAQMVENLSLTPVSAGRIKQLEAVRAIHSVLMYVERAYPEQITIEKAAGISGYEKTRFCQIFKQAVGVSFHKYLNNRRLRAATFLLKSTNLAISQIAQTVGIPQHKTFCRLIKDAYGITPGQFRVSNKEEKHG